MQLIEKMRTKRYTEISLQSIFFFGIHSSLFRYDNITSSSYPYQHFFFTSHIRQCCCKQRGLPNFYLTRQNITRSSPHSSVLSSSISCVAASSNSFCKQLISPKILCTYTRVQWHYKTIYTKPDFHLYILIQITNTRFQDALVVVLRWGIMCICAFQTNRHMMKKYCDKKFTKCLMGFLSVAQFHSHIYCVLLITFYTTLFFTISEIEEMVQYLVILVHVTKYGNTENTIDGHIYRPKNCKFYI